MKVIDNICTRYDRNSFLSSSFMKNIFLPFNGQPSFRIWGGNFVLTLRRCSMTFFVCIDILLRVLVLVVNFILSIYILLTVLVKIFLTKTSATSTMLNLSPQLLFSDDEGEEDVESSPEGEEDVESSPDGEDRGRDIEEIPEEEHNAPEYIQDDLEKIDRVREADPNDEEAQRKLEELKDKYKEFFDIESGNNEEEGLNQLEEYLEEEFPGELEQSEREADILEEEESARKTGNTEDSKDDSKRGGGSASGGGGSGGGDPGEGSSSSGGTQGPSSSRVLEGLGLIGGVLGQIGEVLDNLPLFFSGFLKNLRLPFDYWSYSFWRGNFVLTLCRYSMAFFVCFSLLLGVLNIIVSAGFDNIIINCSNEQSKAKETSVVPHPNLPGWSTVIKKNSNGQIEEYAHMPNDRISGYLSRGSKSNPESLDDDSDSSAPSSSKPTKEGSTASNPIVVEEGSKFPSETEKEEKPQNSSTNDENGKGGPSSSPGDEDDDSLGSEDFSDENDSSGSENSSGSKNKDMDTRLGSIQSDRENLNKAISNANPSGKRKAIEELQERYPKKLKNVDNVDEFLVKVNEELTSKTKEVTGSNVSDVDPDAKLNLHEEHVLVDKARNGDKDAVKELQKRFPPFFEESTSQGLNRVDRFLDLEILDGIRKQRPDLSNSDVEAILASMKENNTKKKDTDKDDDDEDSKGGGDSASGPGGSTSGPSGGSSSAGPSASGGSSSAGPSGGSSSKVLSPLDYVLEKESTEMPSLFEGEE